jgi:nucleotide-binding universal stress UspA family protein
MTMPDVMTEQANATAAVGGVFGPPGQPSGDAAIGGPVIACVAEGPGSLAAARVAGSLARWLGLRLLLATVQQADPRTPWGSSLTPAALLRGRALVQRAARDLGQSAETRVAIGEPAERLLTLAEREGASMVVVDGPDRSRTSGPPSGSVYLALAGAGPSPVVVVPPDVERIASIGPIVCGFDGSEASSSAVRAAAHLAGRLETRLLLVHAANALSATPSSPGGRSEAPRGSLREMASTILRDTAEGLRPTLPSIVLEYGPPAERLADVAERESAQLLVIGSQGEGQIRSTLLGSVASGLATSATRPLLIVPATAHRSDAPSTYSGDAGRVRSAPTSRPAPHA